MPEGATGQILGAASAAMKATQAHGYKIVWFAFLPGSIIAAIGCACLRNPSDRMNWVVGAFILAFLVEAFSYSSRP